MELSRIFSEIKVISVENRKIFPPLVEMGIDARSQNSPFPQIFSNIVC